MKIPNEWKPIIGTLAHNRRFTAAEITEYTHWGKRLNGPAIVRQLLEAEYLRKVDGGYVPTSWGWGWIEAKEHPGW